MKHKLLRAMTICSFIGLSSCSFLSPVAVTPPQKHMISQTPGHVSVAKHPRGVLLVSFPDTQPVFNTTKMAYTNSKYTVAYFSQHEWAETPAQMLQPLLVKTLEGSHTFRAVVTPPYSGQFDYSLQTQIISLQQNFLQKPAMLNLVVRAQLLKNSSNRLLASKVFSISEPMPSESPEGGVYAANQASVRLLKELAIFCREGV